MSGAYLMAAFGMLFAATSAIILFRMVDHFDPPEAQASEAEPKAAA